MSMPSPCDADPPHVRTGFASEVLSAFLKLGCSSFGGPVAHLGYFRAEFVTRRGWLSDAAYGDLVALAQFLPGPASSQTGFALGLMRAGWLGGLAAWLGFTLPSALLMLGIAYGAPLLSGVWGAGLVHGLKLVAVAVVAQAVWGMARTLTPDATRLAIALAAGLAVHFIGSAWMQLAVIVAGALAGVALCRGGATVATDHLPVPFGRGVGIALLVLFALVLGGPPLAAWVTQDHGVALADAFARSGALVFGGGHVVLPLLDAETVRTGWIGKDSFLAGYGAAQAMPGPLFTFATYLGATQSLPPNGIAGAAIATVAIFLPGLLLMAGALPFWSMFRRAPGGQALMRGANAAVVGVLTAALYDPVATSAIGGWGDAVLALLGLIALIAFKAPPIAIVILGALAGLAGALL